jgi:hypothetical protein
MVLVTDQWVPLRTRWALQTCAVGAQLALSGPAVQHLLVARDRQRINHRR